jgi:membrane protease YdiL (CAAX protease family)
VDDSQAIAPIGPTPPPSPPAALLPFDGPLPRWFSSGLALTQIVLVCGIPTQLVIVAALYFGLGMSPLDQNNEYSLQFIAVSSLLDTALVALLIRLFLSLSGETSRDVFIGPRPVSGEMLRGAALVPVAFILLTGLVLFLRAVAPWTHNVAESPFDKFMDSPLDAGIFLVVGVLAGGVREELQRAFTLHRFGQHLGGVWVGLAVFSVAFGAAHYPQGIDVAISVGALGLSWGLLYIRRGSAIMGMTNHAGFNALQVIWAAVARSFGLP